MDNESFNNFTRQFLFFNRDYLGDFFFAFMFFSKKRTFDCANLENFSIEPVIAYYVNDFAHLSSGSKDKSRVMMIVWPNGKVIWSSIVSINDTEVTHYYESTISKKQLSIALESIETICEDRLVRLEAIREDNYDQYYYSLAFDFPVSYIYISQANRKRIKMATCFENSISENDASEIIECRKAWNEIKAIIQQMIPEKGREINPVFVYPAGI